MNHAPNAIVSGLYYRVNRRTQGDFRYVSYLPADAMELPVDVGDVITAKAAPQGLDAALTLQGFNDAFFRAYPASRITVCEGILFNEQRDTKFGTWRVCRTIKHALKLQAECEKQRIHYAEREALWNKERAENLYIGKSYREEAISVEEAVAKHGFGPGWYIKTNGCDVWSEVGPLGVSDRLIWGYRAIWHGNRNGYERQTETFHPTLGELTIRKNRPSFGPVASELTYRPSGFDNLNGLFYIEKR